MAFTEQERPILFSGAMVRAILAGRKTQTRRVMKPQPGDEWHPEVGTCAYEEENGEPGPDFFGAGDENECYRSPYGQPGDRLWVKETWTHTGTEVWKVSDALHALDGKILYAATDNAPCRGCWFPSIHMYRRFSRIALGITDMRVERVQEISEGDAIAEGTGVWFETHPHDSWDGDPDEYRKGYRELWDSINAKRGFGWQSNPWVWVIAFKQVAALTDASAQEE
jgi:hypothetical protein